MSLRELVDNIMSSAEYYPFAMCSTYRYSFPPRPPMCCSSFYLIIHLSIFSSTPLNSLQALEQSVSHSHCMFICPPPKKNPFPPYLWLPPCPRG